MEPREDASRPVSRPQYVPRTEFNAPVRRPVAPQPQAQPPQPQVQNQPQTRPLQQPQSTSLPLTNPLSQASPITAQPSEPQTDANSAQPVSPEVSAQSADPVEVNQMPYASPAPVAPAKPLTFEAPPKVKKKFIKLPKINLKKLSKKTWMAIGALLGVAVFATCIYAFAAYQSNRSDPATILSDALNNHLQLQSVEVQSSTGQVKSNTAFNFSSPREAILSGSATLDRYGSAFSLSTYGDSKKSFIKYDQMPQAIDSQIQKQLQGKWLQLTENGTSVPGASHELADLANPKSQSFGLLIMGNFDEKTRKELANFMIKNKAYKIETGKPVSTKVGKHKAIVLPISLDIGFVKVGMQSAAVSLGYSPNDVAEAVRSVDAYKDAKADLYIAKNGRKILKFVVTTKDGKTREWSYDKFNKTSVNGGPSGAVSWVKYGQYVWQAESQAAKKAKPADLDSVRKRALDNLHNNLASYRAQNGYYPALANINNLSWLSKLSTGAPEMQRDPLAPSLSLAGSPAAGIYAYATNAGCNNVTVACSSYSLTAILSNNQTYVVKSP